MHQFDRYFGCEADHIISLKHGGTTTGDNLAFACIACNRYKGSDIGSVLSETGDLVRLFNPRIDRWADHFALDIDGATIIALTNIGAVTVRLLKLSTAERVMERSALRDAGRYPQS